MHRGDVRYADHGGAHLAFRAWGDGPPLVYVPSQFIPIMSIDDEPAFEQFVARLASFATFLAFDRQGIGLSDPMTAAPTVDDWCAQIDSVITAAGFDSAFLLAHAFGGIAAIHFAATRPARVRGVVFAMAASGALPGLALDTLLSTAQPAHERTELDLLALMAPSRATDVAFRRWWDDAGRRGASPSVAQALLAMQFSASAASDVASVRSPALVVRRPAWDGWDPVNFDIEVSGATCVDIGGVDLLPWLPDSDALADEIEQFVTGYRSTVTGTRVVRTVMFSDVVSSTDTAVRMGDRTWTDVLEMHHRVVRRELARHAGTEIDTAGDGFLVTFASPSAAIRCATELHRAVAELGLRLRIGIHCGEVELHDPGIAGVAVHIGARVQSKASPSETVVTSTVKEMVTGSPFAFELKGRYTLKGVPGRWALWTIAGDD